MQWSFDIAIIPWWIKVSFDYNNLSLVIRHKYWLLALAWSIKWQRDAIMPLCL